LILPKDSNIQYVEDLAGKTIGSQTGTTGQSLLDEDIKTGVLKGKNAVDKPYDSAPIAMQDLKSGRIDAVIIDQAVAKDIAAQNPGYKAVPADYKDGSEMTEQFAVAVAKGSDALLAQINDVITKLVKEGQITKWIDQYTADNSK
jgi:polar amino acid transport system substrate-binding protein